MAEVVVAGAGLAGARTCDLLRAEGVRGRVILLGAEPDPPYDRPPLTTDPDAEVDLRDAMALDVWARADEVRLGVRAVRLVARPGQRPGQPPGHVVECSDGREVEARAVVVATGADPVLPAGWDRAGVHVLHTRSQARSFWAGVGPGVRLVVVGGGWIGCEAAATAASRGADVALFEAGVSVLAGRVPPEVSVRVASWLVEAGVRVRPGIPVRAITDEGGSLAVAGAPADRVLVALGVRPATAWLAGTGVGLATSGAVQVDGWGRSSLPGLFALGDAAERWSPRYRAHLPGGHWTEALNAPTRVAPAVAQWVGGEEADDWWGSPPGQPPADPIPYVFSDISQRRLLVLGAPEAGRVVWREGAGPGSRSQEWTAFTLDRSARLLGLCTSGRPRDMVAARRAMLAHPTGTPGTDPEALADPGASAAAMFPAEG